jgi:hypothetical protein
MESADSGKHDRSPRQTARRLIDSHDPERRESDGAAGAVAVACNHLYRDLSRWVGPDGCHALFSRALVQARGHVATLDEIKLRPGADPYVDGVADSVVSHGDAAVAEGLESMIVHLIELLARLIGDDMATKLIERSIAPHGDGDATSNDRLEEA